MIQIEILRLQIKLTLCFHLYALFMFTGQIFKEIDLKSLIIYIPGLSSKIKDIDFLRYVSKVNRMDPFLQLIMALAVARNGRPKMTGV